MSLPPWSPKTRSPSLGVHYNGIRLIDHAGDESFAVASSTYLGHLDDVSTRVSPVQVPCHPVHSDATGHLQIRDLNRDRETALRPKIGHTWFSCYVNII